MSTLERKFRCTNCNWTGRSIIENTKPMNDFKKIANLIAVGVRDKKCPKCGADTIPNTREMVS